MDRIISPASFSERSGELLTKETCEAAVKKDGLILKFIPEELITPELCALAVRENELAFNFIPKEFLGNGKFLLTDKGLRKKYTQEELLTSNYFYLRSLGASGV
jgi:hypothetical protein